MRGKGENSKSSYGGGLARGALDTRGLGSNSGSSQKVKQSAGRSIWRDHAMCAGDVPALCHGGNGEKVYRITLKSSCRHECADMERGSGRWLAAGRSAVAPRLPHVELIGLQC